MFPLGYTPEDFAEKSEEPVMLNPKIVNVLFKVGEIESFGSGFERTFSECKKSGVEYSYENTKSGFRFTFKRPHGHKNVHETLYEMSETERTVYEAIKANNNATAKIIAEQIGKSDKTVYRAIKILKENQILERKGDDYNGSWEILQ